MTNALTVFLSMKGETIAPGMKIINLTKGYTNIAAEYIQKAVGGDLFEIVPVRSYSPDHMKMIYEAKEEYDQQNIFMYVIPSIRYKYKEDESYGNVSKRNH